MTSEQFANLVKAIDPENSEYIMADQDVVNEYESLTRWEQKDPIAISVLHEGEDIDARCKSIAQMVRRDLEEKIRRFDSVYLTPANAKVGDGATVNYYTDRHAGTIVKVTKATITIRRDKAIRDPNFKPEWIPGGFSAVCLNCNDQQWSYEPDPKGQLHTLHWSRKYNRYGTPGNLSASKDRHEYYDYNF